MYRTLILSLGLLLAGASSAQHQLGPTFYFDAKPYAPFQTDYQDPEVCATATGEHFYWRGRSTWHRMALHNGGQPEDLAEHIQLSGLGRINHRILFQGHFVDICTSWESATGHVHVNKLVSDLTMTPLGPPEKLGTIPLAKTGSYPTFKVDFKLSPDGEKLLIYYDRLHTNEFKVAMCWVLNKEIELEWHNVYKLPAQAYFSNSTWSFHDNGAASVQLHAVEAKNVVATKDGTSERLKLSRNLNKRNTAIYILHGDDFGRINGDDLNMYIDKIYLMYGSGGWRFVGLFRKGGIKDDPIFAWGSINGDGISIENSRPALGDEQDIQIGVDDACYTLSDNITFKSRNVVMMTYRGETVWSANLDGAYSSKSFVLRDNRMFHIGKVAHQDYHAALRGEKTSQTRYEQKGTLIHVEWSDQGRQVSPVFKDGIPPNKSGKLMYGIMDTAQPGVFLIGQNPAGIRAYGYVRYVQE